MRFTLRAKQFSYEERSLTPTLSPEERGKFSSAPGMVTVQ